MSMNKTCPISNFTSEEGSAGMGLHSDLEIRNSTSRISRRLNVLIQDNRLKSPPCNRPSAKDVDMTGFVGSTYIAFGELDLPGSGIISPCHAFRQENVTAVRAQRTLAR